MPSNFSGLTLNRSGYQSAGPIVKNLVAGADAADVAVFDVTALNQVTISFAVAGAALSGLELQGCGNVGAEFFPIALNRKPVLTYGRNDSGSDVTTTPAGVSGMVMIETKGWSDIKIRMKSDGAATVTITAGGK